MLKMLLIYGLVTTKILITKQLLAKVKLRFLENLFFFFLAKIYVDLENCKYEALHLTCSKKCLNIERNHSSAERKNQQQQQQYN